MPFQVGDRVRISESLRDNMHQGSVLQEMLERIGQEYVIQAVDIPWDDTLWYQLDGINFQWPEDGLELTVPQRFLVVRFNTANRNRLVNAQFVYQDQQTAEEEARTLSAADGTEYFVIPLRAVYSTNDPEVNPAGVGF